VSAALVAGAPATVQTCAVVSGGADINTVNNQGCDNSPVAPGTNALNGTIAAKAGPANARVWSISVTNAGSTPAYEVTLAAFTLTQTAGVACTPAITAPTAFPIMLGVLAAGGTASGTITIDFTGCPALARFTLNVPINTIGQAVNTLTRTNQFQ
jgi:hypothetical protein